MVGTGTGAGDSTFTVEYDTTSVGAKNGASYVNNYKRGGLWVGNGTVCILMLFKIIR